jgi:hypothetical protein
MHGAIRAHLDHPQPDAVLNIETHLFNVQLLADTCDYELDIGKEVWLNKGRWSRLIKEYVPRESVRRFVSQADEILRREARLGATANMFCHDPKRYDKKHRWGGCLMGMTFRGDNGKSGPATLTVYSRTSYMGYMGLLDAGVAHVIARQIAEQSGLTTADIGFRWYLSSQQLHGFKTLPYIYSQPDLMGTLERIVRNPPHITPTWQILRGWYKKVLEHWDDAKHDPKRMLAMEKYGPFKRIKRRWMEAKGYLTKRPPPSLSISEVDLGKAI